MLWNYFVSGCKLFEELKKCFILNSKFEPKSTHFVRYLNFLIFLDWPSLPPRASKDVTASKNRRQRRNFHFSHDPSRHRRQTSDEPPEGDHLVPADPRLGRDVRHERLQGRRLLRFARL